MSRSLVALVSLVLLLIAFFAFNIAAGRFLRTARVDLTEHKVFTLTPGSASIARLPEEPVRLSFFYTPEQAQGLPQVQSYARRVGELLEEFVRLSGGKLTLERVNPEPFSEAEDRAAEAGLTGLPVRAGETLYLGLIATNSVGEREVIPFFDPAQETLLEYDVARAIYSLAQAKKPVVGLITTLPIEGMMTDPMTGQPLPAQRRIPPWAFLQEARGLFDVRNLGVSPQVIPEDVGVLLLVHPKGLQPRTLYAIDQFVLRGGKLLAFIDPLCESDIPPDAQRNPLAMLTADRSSTLGPLLGAWGLEMSTDKVAGDLDRSVRVASGGDRNPEPVSFPAWMDLTEAELSREDAVTARLKRLIVASAGALTRKPDAPADAPTAATLVATTARGAMIDASGLRFMPDPKQILQSFTPGSEALALAVRVSGKARSAFPEGRPAAGPDAPPEPEQPEKIPDHLAESTGPINAVIVADADMLADRFWTQEQRLFGSVSLGFTRLADNGDLVVNALDNLLGSTDLISIRARATSARPFTRVQELQRSAEARFLAEQQALEDKIRQTQERLTQLQSAKPDDPTSQLILSPEQREEIEKLRGEYVEARKQLRAVQLNLRQDIEALETRLKIINIGAVPAAVALGAVGLGALRYSRRRKKVSE